MVRQMKPRETKRHLNVIKERLCEIAGVDVKAAFNRWTANCGLPEEQLASDPGFLDCTIAYRHLHWLEPLWAQGKAEWMFSEHAAALYRVKIIRRLDEKAKAR